MSEGVTLPTSEPFSFVIITHKVHHTKSYKDDGNQNLKEKLFLGMGIGDGPLRVCRTIIQKLRALFQLSDGKLYYLCIQGNEKT